VFKRLFGKKNEGFYLQLEDDSNTPKAPAKAKSEPSVTEKVTKSVTEQSAASVEAVKPTTTPVVPTTAKADVKADKEAAKSTKKAESTKKAKSTTKVETPKAPVVAAPPAPAPVITNFATDYLIKPSSASGRRRPGANMNMFLDMARQAKKPANIK
jgi:hypothetical protein